MTERPTIRGLPRTLRVEVLSTDAVDTLHQQTLQVLATSGIDVPSDEIRARLLASGARSGSQGHRVLLPPEVVEEALGRAPDVFELAARVPEYDLRIDGVYGFLAVDGCAAEILDSETRRRRESSKADVARIARLADALPQIGLLWQPVAARDVPRESQSLHELHAEVVNSGKHIQMMTAVTPEAAAGVVEIARLVAGGAEALRQRPILSAFQCSLSPLTYEVGALEAAAVYAEAGVPCGFVVMPISCATAPATAWGLLVQSNAEVIAGIVALQLLVPGSATFYGSCATVMDLRSGAAACGGPEDLFLQMASAQMARHYGVPSSIGTFATGSKRSDWQAGLENGLSGLASCLAGADLLCGAGLLYGAMVYSEEQLILDCEIFDLVRHLVTPATTAVDSAMGELIDSVGPGGHFLGSSHTLTNMRSHWMPRFFDRQGWDEWELQGRPGPEEAAAARVREILATHEPPPLDDGVEEEIVRLIERFESA